MINLIPRKTLMEPSFHIESLNGLLVVSFHGDWKIENQLPSLAAIEEYVEKNTMVKQIQFNVRGLERWDSGFLTFLVNLLKLFTEKKIEPDLSGLPQGVQRLLSLASAVPERKESGRERVSISCCEKVGAAAIDSWKSLTVTVTFIGEFFLSFTKIFAGRARFRASDLLLIIEECGVKALPIVSLISLLVGLILAFVGSIQLKMFGAQIYIADLVGIAMARAMGAIMTGIIMSGRTGAAFAARIGTMQVNEEIDALKTAGIPPMDYLVLPRVIALALMMPLLTLYADLMGILGGLIVGVFGFDLGLLEYYEQTKEALTLTNLFIGVFSGFVFGVLIALAGCLRGLQCGRSASAVGDATTSAVVTSIVSIIIATAIITVLCDVLGI